MPLPELPDTDFLPLRPMTLQDIPAVMAVERQAFPYPWTEGIFRDCLVQGYSGWIYEEAGAIVGYAMLMFVLDEMHLLNLCICPQAQGRGLGTRLLRTLERIGRATKAEVCFLEVRRSNAAAIRLYHKLGFNEIGQRKGYYPARNGREDALVMAKTLLL